MVKLAKGAKTPQGKQKKAPPPKEVEDSEEDEDMEEESSEDEMDIPVKTPAKKTATPAKATPAKPVATPGKKAATPAAKNGKQAKKQESEEEEEEESDEEESEEEAKPVAKKPAAKKPVAKKEDSEDDDEEDDEDDEEESEEEEKPAKKPQVKKPAKDESEDEEDSEDEDEEEDDDEEEMETQAVKAKKATPAKKEESDEEDDEEDDEDDDDDDEEEEEGVSKDSAKRKKEMPKKKGAPEAKKQKTEGGNEGFSVFVANLNSLKDFDELKGALRDFFTKKSLPVQDVRLGVSRRFGYVDFSTAEEVEQAIKLNGKKVLGFEIRVEKANSAAEKTKNAENKKERDSRTLFIKNIPYTTSTEDLQEIFENAKDIRLPTLNDGSSKGIAYVEFSTEAEADKAIEEKQGAELEGRSIFIDYTGEKSQTSGGKRGGTESKVLVVNNLSYNATEDGLQEVFEKATSVKIPQNSLGRAKGFAFIEFSSVEDAKEAFDSCNNTEIDGRSVRIEFGQGGGAQGGGRGGSVQSKTLFVRGLSEDTTEETLRDSFDGSVCARIVTDRDTGASKGFGFVDFSTPEDAKAAKEAMEDWEIDGNKVTLDFAKSKGDGQRGGRGGFGGRGGGRGGFGGRGGGRGGFGGRGGGRGGFGRGGRGGFGGRGGGGFKGGQGKKIKFDD